MTLLIGTDPEVFLFSKLNNRFVSAAGNHFPGTKEMPFPLDRGAMQVDGHALEFNTDPVETEDDFVEVVTTVFQQVKDFVNEVDPDLEVRLEPVAHFDPEYFNRLPVSSKILGCNPDYSSETGGVLEAPDIGDKPIRTSSGHIHVGWTQDEDEFDPIMFRQRLKVAQSMSPILLQTAAKWETSASVERRLYYGREGSFRPKHYGVELRVLDSLWLASEDRMRQVFRATVSAFNEQYQALAA